MQSTELSAYDLMMGAVRRGHLVGLIPAHDVDGSPMIYMRYSTPTEREVLFATCPDVGVRAALALGICVGSRTMAQRRGLTLA